MQQPEQSHPSSCDFWHVSKSRSCRQEPISHVLAQDAVTGERGGETSGGEGSGGDGGGGEGEGGGGEGGGGEGGGEGSGSDGGGSEGGAGQAPLPRPLRALVSCWHV